MTPNVAPRQSRGVQRETPVEPSARALPWVRGALAVAYRVGLLAAVVAASVHALSAVWHFTIDDAGISYAYAKHLAEGEGPVAVVGGPWIEGYSNPLWVFVLALVHRVGLPMFAAAKVLGALFFGAGVASGMAWLCSVEGRSWRSLGAVEAGFAIAMALCAELMVWVPAGLENALFTALLLGMLWLDAREAQRPEAFGASGLCAFALSITRPEAVMYAAPLLAIKLFRAWRGREPMRQAVQALVLFALPFAVYHLGHYLVFGELVPNTYYAKPSWHGGSEYLESTARESGLLYLLPLALVGLFGRLRLVLLAGWACVAGSGFVLYSGGDWMPHARFLSLFGACVVLLAARGVSRIGGLVVGLARRWRVALPREALGFVFSVAALAVWARYQWPRLADIRQKNWCHFCERIADTSRLQRLAKQARLPSHSLVTQDFGGPAWLSDESFYPIDFLGLCDRSIVLIRGKRARGGVRNEFRFYQYLIHEQPTPPSWVLVPPNFWPGFDRSIEHDDYYRLDARLMPRSRRDSFFVLHRGELADYFPPVSVAPRQQVGEVLSVVGSGFFSDPATAAPEVARAEVVPGARVLVLVSFVTGSLLLGGERVLVEASAGSATSSSEAVELDRGIKGLLKQLAVGEPLSLELPLTLPAAPAASYKVTLRVLPGPRGARSLGTAPLLLPLGALEAGSELPRFERVLPRYPAALPAPVEPGLRALRAAVTTTVEQNRRAGRAAARDEALSRRLAGLSSELEARGSSEQAYLAAVWATQVERSAWATLADTVHRLRPAAMDDEHTTELALLRSYYLSGATSELGRLVAFYLGRRRTFEAEYFMQRWPSSASAGAHSTSLRGALEAELRAQLSGEWSGSERVLAQVAVDPLGGAGDFEQGGLEAWQGDLGVFRAGPDQRVKGLRGQHGRGILSSGHGGDGATGELTSREFQIEGHALSLLVGGGTAARKVGVELWVDGEKQLTAAGDDSENLRPVFWNVERFQGKPARLRVVDRGSRRHVLLDRVLLWR